MRKIILTLAVSLDGFIEGPNKEVDWIDFNEEAGDALQQFLQEIDTILYGRISYEQYGNYTPDKSSPEFEKNFYNTVNRMKKYVFSSSNSHFGGDPTVVNSDIDKTMRDLKQQAGKHIWLYGGAGLISTFMNLDLIDEFRLAIIPVILGAGTPLFKDLKQPVKLKLLKAEGSKSGVVEVNYAKT